VFKTTVIIFYTYGMLFVNPFIICFKGCYENVSVVHTNIAITHFKLTQARM